MEPNGDLIVAPLYNIYTMCRTGNHAIIFWMLFNLGGHTQNIDTYCFWNVETGVYFYNDCNHAFYTYPNNIKHLIQSFEDTTPMRVTPTVNSKKVVILRDFLNMFASRIKKFGKKLSSNPSYIHTIQELIFVWKELAKKYHDPQYTFISYNQWVTSKQYRDMISQALGIANEIDNTSYVSHIGDGSSFCGEKLESNIGDYMQRHTQLDIQENKGMLQSVLDDHELVALNKEIFGVDIKNTIDQQILL